MLCERCGVREATTIVTSCDGEECYERHLCSECAAGAASFPDAEEQKRVVEPAMQGAEASGLTEEDIGETLGIDPEELRRIRRGEGVSESEVWDVIKSHLKMS